MDSDSDNNQQSKASFTNLNIDENHLLKKKRPKILGTRVLKTIKPRKIRTICN